MEKIKIQDESNDKKYFTIIPNYILNHSNHWDREVYIQMKRITGEEGTCWTSQNKLAKQCGISINRLKKSLKYLLKNEWISLIGEKIILTAGGNQKVNEYKIIDLWNLNNQFYQTKGVSRNDIPLTKGVSRNEQRGITDEAKGVSSEAYKEEPLLRRTIEEDIILHSEADASQGQIINNLINLFNFNPAYKQFFKISAQRLALARLLNELGEEKLAAAIKLLPQTNSMQYAPTITKPTELENKIAALMAFIQKEKLKTPKVIKI